MEDDVIRVFAQSCSETAATLKSLAINGKRQCMGMRYNDRCMHADCQDGTRDVRPLALAALTNTTLLSLDIVGKQL